MIDFTLRVLDRVTLDVVSWGAVSCIDTSSPLQLSAVVHCMTLASSTGVWISPGCTSAQGPLLGRYWREWKRCTGSLQATTAQVSLVCVFRARVLTAKYLTAKVLAANDVTARVFIATVLTAKVLAAKDVTANVFIAKFLAAKALTATVQARQISPGKPAKKVNEPRGANGASLSLPGKLVSNDFMD